jgi:hypothetical protein
MIPQTKTAVLFFLTLQQHWRRHCWSARTVQLLQLKELHDSLRLLCGSLGPWGLKLETCPTPTAAATGRLTRTIMPHHSNLSPCAELVPNPCMHEPAARRIDHYPLMIQSWECNASTIRHLWQKISNINTSCACDQSLSYCGYGNCKRKIARIKITDSGQDGGEECGVLTPGCDE